MSSHAPDHARIIPLRPVTAAAAPAPEAAAGGPARAPAQPPLPPRPRPARPGLALPVQPGRPPSAREPLWRHIVGDVLRRERLAQERTLRDVADTARISMPYLSEIERGRKEASSEVLAAAARALGLGLADLLALAQGELARLLRPGPARAPAQVIARPGPAPGSADVTGDGRDAVPPAGTGPAGALLPAEAVPPPKPVPPAEAVQPETAPSAGALSPETAPAAGALPGETAPAAGALPPEGTTPAGILSTGRTGPRVIPQPQMSLAA